MGSSDRRPPAEDAAHSRLILFINGDFTLRENGSQIRMAEQLAFAVENLPDVAVYSHRQHPSHPWTTAATARFAAQFPGIELIVENRPRHVHLATRAKNILLALWPAHAAAILGLALPGGPPRYAALRNDPDTRFLLNFVDGCSILNGLPAHFVLETHDIRFVKQAKKFGWPVYSMRVLGKMRSELAMIDQADAAVMISPIDATLLDNLAPNVRQFFVPTYAAHLKPVVRQADKDVDLLFVGANNNFNVEGIVRFVQEQAALVERRSLAIAGRVCDAAEVRDLATRFPNLRLLGFVDDLAPVYAAARVVISPVDGTGLKIKVVEALAHGKPVVGSAHSRDALPPGYEDSVFAMTTEQIDWLLDDPASLAAAEDAAERYYKRFVDAGDRTALLAFLATPKSAR